LIVSATAETEIGSPSRTDVGYVTWIVSIGQFERKLDVVVDRTGDFADHGPKSAN
jgi:hypothetical protein